MAAAITYRIKGTADECTTCERCGKTHLAKTIVLDVVDAVGNTDGIVYFGSDCAARALGRKRSTISRAVAEADSLRAQRRAWAEGIVAVYAPVEHASVRDKAALFFGRNPHLRTKGVRASAEIDSMLARARAELAETL